MNILLTFAGRDYEADLNVYHSLAIPLRHHSGPDCFDAPLPDFEPLRAGTFIGQVSAGAPVNFFNIRLNPHGNGTHTECLGHITAAQESLPDQMRSFSYFTQVITLRPELLANGDEVITAEMVADALSSIGYLDSLKSLIIRTLPNDASKCTRLYSGTNPPYIQATAMRLIVEAGIEHLLLDLPSVDKEHDGGRLAAHKIFWQTESSQPRVNATITELIYVDNIISDGLYLLSIMVPRIMLDAVPSQPIIHPLRAC